MKLPLFVPLQPLLFGLLILLAQTPITAASLPLESPRYGWPTCKPRPVVNSFAPPKKRWLAGNRGVDLETVTGDEVCSAAAGTVSFVGTIAGMPSVAVIHSNGLRTTYQPVIPAVKTGESVQLGTHLGVVGTKREGFLHWGAIRDKDQYVNPLLLLNPRIILKPW